MRKGESYIHGWFALLLVKLDTKRQNYPNIHQCGKTENMYRVTALNVTRIWINRLFGPAQTVWQFLPFLVTFHVVTRYILRYFVCC